MLSIYSIYIFLLPLIFCTILVPLVSRLSTKIGGIDLPDERKVHLQKIPRIGGIAIFVSVLFAILFFCEIDQQLKGVLLGALAIFLTGLADDFAGLPPRHKLAGQLLASGLAVFVGGLRVENIGNPFGVGVIELGYLSAPLTIIGIVGLINAINMLDGLDGLAAGTCTIVSISMTIISYTSGNPTLFPLTLALTGTLMGFLLYNNYPAKIFMGDSGSMLLGYFMGTFSILLVSGSTIPVSPYAPLMLLWVPILDTLAVMFIRFRKKLGIFSPDKNHLHHRLLSFGLGHRFTVLLVFGITYLHNFVLIMSTNLADKNYSILSDSNILLMLALTSLFLYVTISIKASLTSSIGSDSAIDNNPGKPMLSRSFVRVAGYMAAIIKYLLIVIIMMPAFFDHIESTTLTALPFILLIAVTIFFYRVKRSWRNTLLQLYIYSAGALTVFLTENYGRDEFFKGISANIISHILFSVLITVVVSKVVFRKRAMRLVTYPLEYLILLIALSTLLLPPDFVAKYHLLTITIKSVIMFVAFKLLLIRQQERNRKIILAIAVSSVIMLVRHYMQF